MVEQSDFYATSPVPADRFLWKGEQPFTAFQYHERGSLDVRVFEQNIWWVSRQNTPYLLKELSSRQLTNVIKQLFLNVEIYYAAALLRYATLQMMALLPSEEAPANFEEYTAYLDSQIPPRTMAAPQWLDQTPLVQEIYSLLDGKNANQ